MLQYRAWVPEHSERYVQSIAERVSRQDLDATERELEELIAENRSIHERECVNLNPATNVMNPRAEAVLAQGLGSRPSLGYPGDKYEMGLEAVERIEVVAAELAAEVFGARYAEVRVPSGAIANLYVFMATCEPGDTIIAPPPSIGGHVTHHAGGSAGLYGVVTHPAPVDADRYTVDVEALRADRAAAPPEADHDRRQPQPVPAPGPESARIADEVGPTCCSTPRTCAA